MTNSQTQTYRTALKEARDAFDKATSKLYDISYETVKLKDEITRLRRTITALAAMCSESPFSDGLGITESCIEVMDSARAPMTTVDVMGALERMGFDLASQKNAAASVHAVLGRLATKGKIEKVTDSDNAVIWKGPNFDPNWNQITDDDIPF